MIDDRERVWVKVHVSNSLWLKGGNRAFVSFPDGRLLLTFPQPIGNPVTMLVKKVKNVSRKDPLTIVVDSGLWNYGHVTLTFDSKEDAEKTELQLREI